MIIFALCFAMGEAHMWCTFSKCKARLDYYLILGLVFLGIPSKYTRKFVDVLYV
jgi:hypothetical protein